DLYSRTDVSLQLLLTEPFLRHTRLGLQYVGILIFGICGWRSCVRTWRQLTGGRRTCQSEGRGRVSSFEASGQYEDVVRWFILRIRCPLCGRRNDAERHRQAHREKGSLHIVTSSVDRIHKPCHEMLHL